MSDIDRNLAAFADLAREILGSPLAILGHDLKEHVAMGWLSVPQPVMVSYDSLLFGGVLLECETGQICEFTERFHTSFAALALPDSRYAVLGPYLADKTDESSFDMILSENGIPLDRRARYLELYENLPVLCEDKIRSFFSCLSVTVFHTPLLSDSFSAVDAGTDPAPCPVYEEDKLQAQAEMLEQRCIQEQKMLELVARGDFEGLRPYLNTALSLILAPSKLRNDKNFLLIMNTLMRKAVESAHVHPLYINRLSTRYAIRIEQLTLRESTIAFRREMIRDYCDLVRSHSLAQYSPNVRNALNHIQFNLAGALTLTGIAKKINVNPAYLSTQFNRETGISLTQYITSRRVDESMSLLRHGHLSISQIASTVGFSDVNYFSRVFKQITGSTPTSYRSLSQTS